MERRQSNAERAAAQGWDIPQSTREELITEKETLDRRYQPSAREELLIERQEERRLANMRQSIGSDISGWTEFKRGCWLAAGATAFFVVVISVALLVLSVVGVSLVALLAGFLR